MLRTAAHVHTFILITAKPPAELNKQDGKVEDSWPEK